jgi:Lon protease-like protein
LLADCLDGDRRFGILFLPDGTAEHELPRGHVGTVAVIEAANAMPDGRSNILVRGAERFTLARFTESEAPYHVGEVDGYDDEPEPAAPQESAAERVREQFGRVASAARTLADDRSPVPPLPDDPALLAFRIASLIDIDAGLRQRLLASRSALERLHEIESVLARAVEPLERRATVHLRAKTNGRGPTQQET